MSKEILFLNAAFTICLHLSESVALLVVNIELSETSAWWLGANPFGELSSYWVGKCIAGSSSKSDCSKIKFLAFLLFLMP